MGSSSERRTSGLWAYLVGGAAIAIGVGVLVSGRLHHAIDHQDLDARVDHVMRTTPLIDGHNDIPYLLRLELKNSIYNAEKFSFETGRSTSPQAD